MAVPDKVKRVEGKNRGDIFGYFLSTCGWCARTRSLLDSLGVEYSYLYVDLLDDEDRDQAVDELKRWNPSGTFPTIVINGSRTIVGHQDEKLREALRDGN